MKQNHPEIEVIAITGGGDDGMNFLPEAQELGAHYTLRKPFGLQDLQDTIDVITKRLPCNRE